MADESEVDRRLRLALERIVREASTRTRRPDRERGSGVIKDWDPFTGDWVYEDSPAQWARKRGLK